MTQVDVVHEFQRTVNADTANAVGQYDAFVQRLEQVSSHGNAQIRSMTGGPDSFSRARLIEIMASNYQTASADVKVMVRDKALASLLKDNYLVVKEVVARMTNPYLVGDMVREEPLSHPGTRGNTNRLRNDLDIENPDALQGWLETTGSGMFAAASIARLTDQQEVVSQVMGQNEQLFLNAAHVVAASQDMSATIEKLQGSNTPKEELTEDYCSSYVMEFAELIRSQARQAAWLPIGSNILRLYKR